MTAKARVGRGNMVQGSRILSGAARRRRRGGLSYKPPTPTRATFSHIQTVVPLEDVVEQASTKTPSPQFRRMSAQEEIDNSIHSEPLSLATTVSLLTHCRAPLSFAEATAMPRTGREHGSRASAANDEALADSPASHLSGPPKLTFKSNASKKKVKKWAPFDLNSVEPASSEDDSSSQYQRPGSTSSTRTTTSPTRAGLSSQGTGLPVASFAEVAAGIYAIADPPTFTAAAVSLQPEPHKEGDDQHVSLGLAVEEKGKGKEIVQQGGSIYDGNRRPTLEAIQRGDSDIDNDLTPTPESYHRFPDPYQAIERVETKKDDITHLSDTESVKGKLADIMSRMDDAFGVEEWAAAMPAMDENNSPEHLTIKPQPVTYTTVGSLAKSNEALKFTAPVRLQREGSSRRPLVGVLSINQARGAEAYFAGRTPTQSNFGFNSQALPQQPFRTSLYNNTGNSSRPMIASPAVGLDSPYNSGQTNPSATRVNVNASAQNLSMDQHRPLMNDQGMAKEQSSNWKRARGQNISTQSSMTGLPDKMQTIQRLAQYDNPHQQYAKERLSGFAIANPVVQSSVNPSLAIPPQPGPYGSHMGHTATTFPTSSHIARGNQGQGVLDYNFRFPNKAGGAVPHFDQAQGLGPASSMTPKESVYHQNQLPPGYPRPLTAGPPGQRPAAIGSNRSKPSVPQALIPQQQAARQSVQHSANENHSKYPWSNMTEAKDRPPFRSVRADPAGNEIRNTLPWSEIQKHYPHGPPFDMKSEFNFLSVRDYEKNMGIPFDRTDEEDMKKKQEDWFYSGLRQSQKTIEEREADNRERELGVNVGPAKSPSRFENKNPLSADQIIDMSATNVAAPLLGSLFGSLLSYADEHDNDPVKKAMMSMNNFYDPPAWMVDTSEKGLKSFFGDDCGPTPKRLGRDPRYRFDN